MSDTTMPPEATPPQISQQEIGRQRKEHNMYCRNCGKEVDPQAVACPGCGVPPLLEKKYCHNCGSTTGPTQVICTKCGVALARQTLATGTKSKVAAGLLGIFLSWLGIHKFYLGYTKEGVIMLLVSILGGVVTCGAATGVMSIIGLIEGIIYLTKSDEEFERLYVQGHKGWF
jgi:TM2 domain-containing membrane protein YozV/RNA polymerase subunit RPABC4/transcription elongation factor Spt4